MTTDLFASDRWLSAKEITGYGSREKPWLVVKTNANGEVPIKDCRTQRDAIFIATDRNHKEAKKHRRANTWRKRNGDPEIGRDQFDVYVVRRWK